MSNQTRNPIETVKRIIESRIQYCESKINTAKEMQNDSFTFAFEWGYLSDRYQQEILLASLKYLLGLTESEDFAAFLTNHYKEFNKRIKQYNPTSISTSLSKNTAEALKHTVNIEMLEICDTLINEIDKTV